MVDGTPILSFNPYKVSNLLLKRNPLYSKAHLSVISKNESKIEMRNRIF